MAEQTFKGLLQLNSKPYTVAQSENKVLRAGEPLAVTITGDDPSASETVTMLKIGDGTTPFNDLPWLSGLASDVYDWALQPEKPTYNIEEINTLIDYNDETRFLIGSQKDSLYMNGIVMTPHPSGGGGVVLFASNGTSTLESFGIQENGEVFISDNILNSLWDKLQAKMSLSPFDITATAENQIMLSDSSNKFQAVNLVGADYSTVRPRGIRIVTSVSEASGTPEGCFSAVIGG